MLMGHCHLFPGGLTDAARDEFGIPGTPEHLHSFMLSCGFSRAQAISPVENPPSASVKARMDGDADGLDWLLGQPHVGVDENAALIATAAIVPHRADALAKLEKALSAGVRILKFHPIIMQSDPQNAASAPFWKMAQEARMSVTYHTGGGDWQWTDKHAHPQAAAELARRYGGLVVLMAHCGVFGQRHLFDETIAAAELPNVYLDTTAALIQVGPQRWRDALDRLGCEGIVYGNDYPWVTRESVERELEFLDNLGLAGDEREAILGGNLRRLVKRDRGCSPGRRAGGQVD